ncbi:hypothetical protein KCU83_g495, partial [Aureobasidium melanogenum]
LLASPRETDIMSWAFLSCAIHLRDASVTVTLHSKPIVAATPIYARNSADGRQGSPANPRVRCGRLAQSETDAVTNGVLQDDMRLHVTNQWEISATSRSHKDFSTITSASVFLSSDLIAIPSNTCGSTTCTTPSLSWVWKDEIEQYNWTKARGGFCMPPTVTTSPPIVGAHPQIHAGIAPQFMPLVYQYEVSLTLSGFVDKLPRLANPNSHKGQDGTPTDVEIARKEACEVDASRDCIAANVFEHAMIHAERTVPKTYSDATDDLIDALHLKPVKIPGRGLGNVLSRYHHTEHANTTVYGCDQKGQTEFLRTDKQERNRENPEKDEAYKLIGRDGHESTSIPTYGHVNCCSIRKRNGLLTLYSTPDEIQKDSLQQGNIASAEAPSEAVLHREADVPTKSTPGNEGREEGSVTLWQACHEIYKRKLCQYSNHCMYCGILPHQQVQSR